MKYCVFVILYISLPNCLLEAFEKQRKWICSHGLFSKIELDSYFASATDMLSTSWAQGPTWPNESAHNKKPIKFYFIFLAERCDLWDLSSLPRTKPRPLAVIDGFLIEQERCRSQNFRMRCQWALHESNRIASPEWKNTGTFGVPPYAKSHQDLLCKQFKLTVKQSSPNCIPSSSFSLPWRWSSVVESAPSEGQVRGSFV